MNEYQLGKDIADLQARVRDLEARLIGSKHIDIKIYSWIVESF